MTCSKINRLPPFSINTREQSVCSLLLLQRMTTSTSRVRLYLIRHAESEANLNPMIIGGQSIPSVLSPLGNDQAVLLGKRLKYQKSQIRLYIFFHCCSCQTNSRDCFRNHGNRSIEINHLQCTFRTISRFMGRTESSVVLQQWNTSANGWSTYWI